MCNTQSIDQSINLRFRQCDQTQNYHEIMFYQKKYCNAQRFISRLFFSILFTRIYKYGRLNFYWKRHLGNKTNNASESYLIVLFVQYWYTVVSFFTTKSNWKKNSLKNYPIHQYFFKFINVLGDKFILLFSRACKIFCLLK